MQVKESTNHVENCNYPYQLKSCKKILDFLIDETAKLKLTFLSFSDFFFRFCTFLWMCWLSDSTCYKMEMRVTSLTLLY